MKFLLPFLLKKNKMLAKKGYRGLILSMKFLLPFLLKKNRHFSVCQSTLFINEVSFTFFIKI